MKHIFSIRFDLFSVSQFLAVVYAYKRMILHICALIINHYIIWQKLSNYWHIFFYVGLLCATLMKSATGRNSKRPRAYVVCSFAKMPC